MAFQVKPFFLHSVSDFAYPLALASLLTLSAPDHRGIDNLQPELVLQAGDASTQLLAYNDAGTVLGTAGILDNTIRIWDVHKGYLLRTIYFEQSVSQLVFDSTGTRVAAVGLDALGVFDLRSGEPLLRRTTDMRYTPTTIRFGQDPTKLWLGYPNGRVNRIDMQDGQVTEVAKAIPGADSSVTNAEGTTLFVQSDDLYIKHVSDTVPIELASFEHARNTHFRLSDDGQWAASISADRKLLKIWNMKDQHEERPLPIGNSPVVAIAFLNGGRQVLIGTSEGMLELWDFERREMLVSWASFEYHDRFHFGEDWLAATPSGLFEGSPRGWKRLLVRFHHNSFESVPIDRYFADFYKPGILGDALNGRPVAATKDISQIDHDVPTVRLSAGGKQAAVWTSTTTTLEITLNVRKGAKVMEARDMHLMRNGFLVETWDGPLKDDGDGSIHLTATAAVLPGLNVFTAYCFNAANVKSDDASITLNGADELRRPRREFILAIGINDYANPAFKLTYAADDARAIANEIRRHREALPVGHGPRGTMVISPNGSQWTFGDSEHVVVLEDAEATRKNILLALARIAKGEAVPLPSDAPAKLQEFNSAAEPGDDVFLFFAGHGFAQDGLFYLVPYDLHYSGSPRDLGERVPRELVISALSSTQLYDALKPLQANTVLLLIDACHSGQVLASEQNRLGLLNSHSLGQLAFDKGIYVLAASQAYQSAIESTQYHHGLMSEALIEGLKSTEADTSQDGFVDIQEWIQYASRRVPELQTSRSDRVGSSRGFENDDVEGDWLQRPRALLPYQGAIGPAFMATVPAPGAATK